MRVLPHLLRFTKNIYFIFTACFILWMVFLDSNDIRTQRKLSRHLEELELEKKFYQKKIEEVKKDRNELMSNDKLLEKFAREKYLMKKPDEDVYVIVKE